MACALAEVIAPNPPLEQDLTAANALPSADHLLGTDAIGRDVLSRLLHGGAPDGQAQVRRAHVDTVDSGVAQSSRTLARPKGVPIMMMTSRVASESAGVGPPCRPERMGP